MKHLSFILFLCFIVFFLHGFKQHGNIDVDRKLFTITGRAQGTTYTIKYVNHDSIPLQLSIDSLLLDIDNSLSLYKSSSLISQFNMSNTGVQHDTHLLNVVTSAIAISTSTMNCFDITSKPISALWGFGSSSKKQPPHFTELISTLKLVGSDHLFFRNDSLLKNNPKTMIDCDGIAQGYSVDQLSSLLKKNGINNFVVELGGEIYASGNNLKGDKWIIGIEDPSSFLGDDHLLSINVSLSGKAITTSGSLKKFRKLGTRYFSHIMDPRTGFPVNNGIISVTVISNDAMSADAYDNAFTVMGLNDSFSHFRSNDSIGIHIVYSKPDGSLADTSNAYFVQFITNQRS